MQTNKELTDYLLRAHIDYVTGSHRKSRSSRNELRAAIIHSAALALLTAAIVAFAGH